MEGNPNYEFVKSLGSRTMLQHALKIGVVAVALGLMAQDAGAFGRCGRWGGGYGGCGGYGCGYGGWGGYGYGGWGGYGWGYGYGYPGYGFGYPGYGWGYSGWGPGGYLASSSGASATSSVVSSSQMDSNSALISVSVPADAKVFINGHPTTSTGERREYISKGLQPESLYAYRVRVEFVRNDKPVTEEKVVQLTAGQTSSLAFTGASKAQMAGTQAPLKR